MSYCTWKTMKIQNLTDTIFCSRCEQKATAFLAIYSLDIQFDRQNVGTHCGRSEQPQHQVSEISQIWRFISDEFYEAC